MPEAISGPPGLPGAPPPESQNEKPSHTAADYAAELAAAEEESAEDIVIGWMRALQAVPAESADGGFDQLHVRTVLREQVLSAHGTRHPDTGEVTARGLEILRGNLRLLSMLIDPDADRVDQARAMEYAYSYYDLVMADARREDNERNEHRRATHDMLTGLPNLLGLRERLDPMIERAEAGEVGGFALLFLDLDGFKLINDILGHSKGNEVLTGVAHVLKHATRNPDRGREPDVVARPRTEGDLEGATISGESARYGGDEFVVLLPYHQPRGVPASDVDGTIRAIGIPAIASRVTERITEYMRRATNDRIPGVGVSAGCVLWRPSLDANEILRRADAAMYRVKQARKAGKLPATETIVIDARDITE